MRVTSKIAWAFLRGGRRRLEIFWVSALAVSSVALSVGAVISVFSVVEGFDRGFRDKFLAAYAPLVVYQGGSSPLDVEHGLRDWWTWRRDLMHKLAGGAIGASPFVYFMTMARIGNVTQGIQVRGVVPWMRGLVQSWDGLVTPDSALRMLDEDQHQLQHLGPIAAQPPIILGRGLAAQLGAGIGSQIDLVRSLDTSLGASVQFKTFQVAGIYDSGLSLRDNNVGWVSLATAQAIAGLGDRVSGLEVGLSDATRSTEYAKILKKAYRIPLTIWDWQSSNAELFRVLASEQGLVALIVAVVVLLALFNIVSTLSVSVSQCQSEISVLRALGATRMRVIGIFVQQSAVLGGIGASCGSLLALGISWLVANSPVAILPELYLIHRLPVVTNPWVYLWVNGLAVGLAALAGGIPAFAAAKEPPRLGLASW